MRRVVVTGLGMVTPLGCGVEITWQRLLAGQSGARRVESFDVSDLPAKIACQLPRGDGSDGTFNADQWMEPKSSARSMISSSMRWRRHVRLWMMPTGIPLPMKTSAPRA